MTPEELYDLIILKGKELTPEKQMGKLHKAMLMECCENVITSNKEKDLSNDILVVSTLTALEVCSGMMQGMVKALIPEFGDIITLNYRGDTFVLDQNSPLVKASMGN